MNQVEVFPQLRLGEVLLAVATTNETALVNPRAERNAGYGCSRIERMKFVGVVCGDVRLEVYIGLMAELTSSFHPFDRTFAFLLLGAGATA